MQGPLGACYLNGLSLKMFSKLLEADFVGKLQPIPLPSAGKAKFAIVGNYPYALQSSQDKRPCS
jgi:hypothetical protein